MAKKLTVFSFKLYVFYSSYAAITFISLDAQLFVNMLFCKSLKSLRICLDLNLIRRPQSALEAFVYCCKTSLILK